MGTSPQLLLADGGRIVFSADAKMYGRPDGSLQIVGRWRRVQGPRHISPGEVIWENPAGETQGVTLGTRQGAVYISAQSVVTPTQAARLMKKSTVWIYKLIKSGKLRCVRRRDARPKVIPLSEVKRLLGFDRAHGPWLVG